MVTAIQLDLQDELLDMNANDGSHHGNLESNGDDNDSQGSEEGGNPRESRVARRGEQLVDHPPTQL